jgi:hypothetical protein
MRLSSRVTALGICLAASAAHADESGDRSPWAGSEFSLKHAFSIGSFMPGFERTYNPLVIQALSIDPAWRLSSELRLVGHLGVQTELTNSDVDAYERQPLLEDSTVTASLRLPAMWPNAKAIASLRLLLPTSKEAIARERIVAASPALNVGHAFSPREGFEVTPFVTLRATYDWQLTTTLVYDGPTIRGCDAARGEACEALDHDGARSSVATFVETVGVNVALPHRVGLTAQAWWVQAWLYELTPATGPTGMPVASIDSTDWRIGNVYLLGAEWQWTPHWKVSGGFQTENPQRRPDGAYYAPFFNRYTQLFVTATAVLWPLETR